MDKIEKLEDIEMIVKYNADKFLKQLNKVVEELEKLEHTEIKVEIFQKQPEEKLKEEDMLRWVRNGGVLKVESEKQNKKEGTD